MGSMNITEKIIAVPHLGRYRIDPDDSVISFRTRHVFGLLPVRGTFAVRAGTIDISQPLGDSRLSVEIDPASFDTGNGTRDREVRSATYLNTATYPAMTFVSEQLDEVSLTGTLTVRGTSRPVTVSIEESTVSPSRFTVRATTRIDRVEFGVTAGRGITGRYLDLSLDVTCVRK